MYDLYRRRGDEYLTEDVFEVMRNQLKNTRIQTTYFRCEYF